MAKTPKKTKTSRTGAQYYQSDRQRKARLNAKPGSRTEMDDLIRQALMEKVYSGELSPERAGNMNSGVFIDSIDDAYRSKRKK